MRPFLLCLIALIGLTWMPFGTASAARDVDEYDLKATLLSKLPRFIEWPPYKAPADKGDPKGGGAKAPAGPDSDADGDKLTFKVGVLGDNPFGKRLAQAFKDKTIEGRKVELVYFKKIKDLKHVDLLYVTEGSALVFWKIRDQFIGKGTLLVGESKGFGKDSGHINFYKRSGSIRFEANPERLKRDKFKASSKLLKLARIVKS